MSEATLETDVEGLIKRLKQHAGKRAPVQGLVGGIPWAMHLRAYDAYCKKWGGQDALIDLEGKNCRGGFGTEELDDFIPGWRAELESPMPPELAEEAASALSRLSEQVKALEGERDEANRQLLALRMARPPQPDLRDLSLLFGRHRNEIDDNRAWRLNEWLKTQLADSRGAL